MACIVPGKQTQGKIQLGRADVREDATLTMLFFLSYTDIDWRSIAIFEK